MTLEDSRVEEEEHGQGKVEEGIMEKVMILGICFLSSQEGKRNNSCWSQWMLIPTMDLDMTFCHGNSRPVFISYYLAVLWYVES